MYAARALVLALAAMILAAGVAISVDAAWIAVLPLGTGLGVVWATRRRGARDGMAHERLENELRLQIGELRESQARVTQGADAERRRIERDLHDGCQQQLIALRIKLSLAEELVSARQRLGAGTHPRDLRRRRVRAEDLQALVHGIYPSILLDRGLAAALSAIGRSAPMPVRVLAEGSSRYPAEVEAAVYFACAEALQNTAKHAGTGTTARIALHDNGHGLAFEVRDDGRGFADRRQRRKRAGQHAGSPQRRGRAPGGHLGSRLWDHRSRVGGPRRAPHRCRLISEASLDSTTP